VLRGDAHLVDVGVSRELCQRRNARLPPEAGDARRADRLGRIARVRQHDLAAVDRAALGGGLRGDQAVEERIRHRVDQTEPEGRRRQAADVVNRRVCRLSFEGRVAGLVVEAGELTDREQLAQRTALVRERVEHAVVEPPEAALDLLAGAADRAVAVALPAGLGVEDRTETVVYVFERVERAAGLCQQTGARLDTGQSIAEHRRHGRGRVIRQVTAAGANERRRQQQLARMGPFHCSPPRKRTNE